MSDLTATISELLQETAAAHHRAYAASDGADAEWPLWYADYLRERLPALLQAEITQSELVYLFVMLDKQQALDAPDTFWADYYAGELAARYRPNVAGESA